MQDSIPPQPKVYGVVGFEVQALDLRVCGIEMRKFMVVFSGKGVQELTHRPQSSSFLGLPYRILNMNPQKELLWGLWSCAAFME